MQRSFWLFLFLISSISRVFCQIDNEFWFVAPEVSVNHGDRPIYIRVSTMELPAEVLLRMPANLNFTPITVSIAANSTYSFNMTPFIDSIENRPADEILNKGLLLTSDQLVTSYYEIANASNPGIFPMKGKNALGTEFYISGQNDYANQINDGSEAFDIVATEDSTFVTVTPSLVIVGHSAGVPFQIMLNKGQTFSARTLITIASATLAGSHIVASKPVAVSISDDSIITGGWDIIGDQIVPVNLLGWNYIAVKGYADNTAGNNDERVYVLATMDNTDVYIDGNAIPAATLNTGQQFDYVIPPINNTAYFSCTNPVYVYHLSGNPGEAGASILPQDSCTGSKQIGFNRTSGGFFAMLILTRNGNQDNFLLNGSGAVILGSDFMVVPGTGNSWVYCRKSMTTAQVPTGTNLVSNTLGDFHLGIINNVGASSEYGYYSAFSSLYLGTNRNICQGDSITMDGGPYMASYEWKHYMGANWIIVDTTRFFTTTDTGFFACMTNGDYCTLRDTIHISFYPNGTVSLGPDRVICEGTSTTLDPGLFVTYLWNTGSTSPTITTDTAGIFWVRVTNNNDCVARDTVMISIDSLPKVSGPLTGPGTVCQGQNGVNYSVSLMPFASSYTWTLPSGASGTSTTSSIILDFSLSAVSGNLKVKGNNYCGDGPEIALPVTVNPLPGVCDAIAGPATVCQGQTSVIYNIPPVTDATSYSWSVPSGANIIAGAGTNLITVDFTLAASSGTFTANGFNGCGNSNTSVLPVTVNLFPLPAGTITGPATVCQGQTGVVYSIPVIQGADSYLWTLPSGAFIISGAGTDTIKVYFDSASVSGIITVKGHSNNCGDGLPSFMAILVNPLPAPAGLISGPNPVCQGQNGVTYSVPIIANATTYIWTVPPGATIVSGSGTNTITLNISTSAVSGNITVKGNNVLCGDGLSSTLIFVVNPLPGAAGTITGMTPVCQAQQNVVYTIPAVMYATSYNWIFTGTGGTIINNGATASITFSSSAVGGNLYVNGHNACGDGTVSPAFNIVVNPIPLVSLGICNQVVTHDAQPFTLRGGIPLGGIFSGIAVNGTTFNPSSVPAWKDTSIVNYTYTNVFNCQSRATQTIQVLPVQPFLCGNTLADVRDNKTYLTARIGTQCWMATNLDHGSVISSSIVPADNCIPEKYCYNDNPANCLVNGGLYHWDELMQYGTQTGIQGLCPPAWHVPTETDWNILFNQYISSGFAGSPLKYTGYSGFDLFLTGIRAMDRTWEFDSFATLLWSSDPIGINKAWAHGMNTYNPSVSFYPASRSNAFSVRCIKD